MDDREVRRRVGAVEERLAALEELAEPQRSVALDAVRELVELYGECLNRLLAHARSGGDLDRALAGDELVAHMLLLHGLHPEGAPARVEAALAAVRPQLASRSATVELESIDGDAARLRFAAAKPLPEALVEIFERAVLAAAPELARVESVGAVAEEGFVPLGTLRRKGGAA